jgi:hypothetical protein
LPATASASLFEISRHRSPPLALELPPPLLELDAELAGDADVLLADDDEPLALGLLLPHAASAPAAKTTTHTQLVRVLHRIACAP